MSTDVSPNHNAYTDKFGVYIPSSRMYTIFPANGNTSTIFADRWAFPYLDNNELTNTSSPAASLIHENSDGSLKMNKPITDITVTDGLASFKFMGGTTGLFEQKVLGEPKILYDFGPIYIIRNAQGEIKKVIKR